MTINSLGFPIQNEKTSLIKCCLPSAERDPPGLVPLHCSCVTCNSHSPSIIASGFLFLSHPTFQLGHFPFQQHLKGVFLCCKSSIVGFQWVISSKPCYRLKEYMYIRQICVCVIENTPLHSYLIFFLWDLINKWYSPDCIGCYKLELWLSNMSYLQSNKMLWK